eukprot:927604-Amphidinium_carterae.1
MGAAQQTGIVDVNLPRIPTSPARIWRALSGIVALAGTTISVTEQSVLLANLLVAMPRSRRQ